MYRLFGEYAHRYDLHTPPDHYRHDHEFILSEAAALGSPCRLLDVGCGTGVLVSKARRAGILANGIDISPEMIRAGSAHNGMESVLSVGSMQNINALADYDVIVALSWSINYCEGRDDLTQILRKMHDALRAGGRIILQLAHAANVTGERMEDRESGPTGEKDDVILAYDFAPIAGPEMRMRARYSYQCISQNEQATEEHLLTMTDAGVVATCIGEVGFTDIALYDSWRQDPFAQSASPFVCATKPSP